MPFGTKWRKLVRFLYTSDCLQSAAAVRNCEVGVVFYVYHMMVTYPMMYYKRYFEKRVLRTIIAVQMKSEASSSMEHLKEEFGIGVMEASIDSDMGAQTISALGIKVILLYTGLKQMLKWANIYVIFFMKSVTFTP